MFRRRTTSDASAASDRPAPGSTGPGLGASLFESGWVLPRSMISGGAPAWTLVGTVASDTATPVDRAGLVVGEGWSLDWWIGADDRWHVPTREAASRQQLINDAPVVETLVRIPGGDAVHRAYGMRAPRDVGDEWVVAEVENSTPVPFAVALVIRPMVADGIGSVSQITIEPVAGGTGRDEAHLVRVDGRPAVVVPRRPARLAAGSAADGDVIDVVTSGAAGRDLLTAACPDGLATMALVFPLTHTSILRALLPVGEVGSEISYPSVVPDAPTVAAGWDVHRRGPRFELPDGRLAATLSRARAQVQLSHDGASVRRDGHRSAEVEPGATATLLAAFDVLDRPNDVGPILVRWPDRPLPPEPEMDSLVLSAVATHWRLHHVDGLLDWMLPEVSAAVERLHRANRKGRLDTAALRWRAADGLARAAAMLTEAHQPDAAAAVRELADLIGSNLTRSEPGNAFERLLLVARLADGGDPTAGDRLAEVVADATATGTWAGPGPGGRPVGHDLAAAAALVLAVRSLLVSERPGELALLPVHPDSWYGGGIEVHDAPTAHGMLSYAVRWHGTRPALLWDLRPHPDADPVTITCPGLDPAWTTAEVKGEALLGEVTPPEGAEALELVVEHPDIDPEMRRPAEQPAPPPTDLPEGGTFS